MIVSRNLLSCLLLVGLSSFLAGCGGSSASNGGSGGGTTPIGGVSSPLTIDNAGVVPVLSSGQTSSVIYVHNNSTSTISGIRYASDVNIKDSTSAFLDAKNVAACSTIGAGQSCALSFTTPEISNIEAQGSAVITASYTYNNDSRQFSQVLNFAKVDADNADGAKFNSGVTLNNSGNPSAYGVIYLYGTGRGQIFNVNSIKSNKSAVKIIQGNISGRELQSGYVQAVEVALTNDTTQATNSTTAKSLTADNKSLQSDSITATLTADSSLGSSNFTSDALVGVAPSNTGALLVTGNIPLINSAVNSPTGQMFISNVGNATATIILPTYPSGVVSIGGSNQCGSTLDVGSSCILNFSVPQAPSSGSITVNYTGGNLYTSLVNNLTWYNPGGALISVSSANNPMSLVSGAAAIDNIVTIANLGNYDITGMALTITGNTGAATATPGTISCLDGNSQSTNTTLKVGGTCTVSIGMSSTTATNGQLTFSVGGSYNDGAAKTYSRSGTFAYSAILDQAVLNITAAVPMVITANNIESYSQILTIANVGTKPATLNSFESQNFPSALVVTSNNCGATLVNGLSCQVVVKLGPTSTGGTTGKSYYIVHYDTTGSASTSIAYTINTESQSVALTAVTPASGITGTGDSGTPMIIQGSNTNPYIDFTYTNTGTSTVQITGVLNPNSSSIWNVDTANSTCYSDGSLPSGNLAPNATCIIRFKNVLSIGADALNVEDSYNSSITLPTLVFKSVSSNNIFTLQPTLPSPLTGGNLLSVTNHQPTIVNTVNATGGNVEVGSSIANMDASYGTINIISKFESYFDLGNGSGYLSESTGCSNSQTNGVNTQTCGFTANGYKSMVYRVNLDTPSGTSLNTLFSKSMTANMTSSMSPTNLTSTITIANLRFRQIAAGTSTCGITDNYATYCWGGNSNGQVGNNSTTNALLPVQILQGAIPLGVVLKYIDAGENNVCAIGSNESSYCWGSDVSGALGNGDGTYQQSLVPSLVAKGAIPANITLKSISVGYNYACGVGTNSKVYCWGNNSYGQLGNGESSNNPYNTPVAVSDGVIPPTTKILSVSAGSVTACAVGSDGEAYCWGSNAATGMLGNGISAGISVTPVLVSQGSVPANVSLISVVNGTYANCALGNDGNSYCWGQGYSLGNGNTLTIQSSPAPVTQTSSGVFHSMATSSFGVLCGINTSGAAYCWGTAGSGQLGNGMNNSSGTPVAVLQVQLPIGTTFTSIVGGDATCAIGTNYFAYCWGNNSAGAIGNNTTTNSPTAVAVLPPA